MTQLAVEQGMDHSVSDIVTGGHVSSVRGNAVDPRHVASFTIPRFHGHINFTESRPCCIFVVIGCCLAVALNGADRCYARVQAFFAGEAQMFKKHRSKIRYMLIFIIAVVIYNEYISYSLKRWFSWPTIRCSASSNCIKILLVADPQILGEQTHFPRGALMRWDSDRYLYKTFQKAFYHVQPHVVVFLGDIMDEGNIATNDEYRRYIERFNDVFHVSHRVKFVFLPGDNDIGGEYEPLNVRKLEKFQETFKQPDVLHIGLTDMFKVNRLTYTFPKLNENSRQLQGNRTRIILSHLPLLFAPSAYVHQVVTQIRPHVIFTAHDHKSVHTSADKDTGEERLAEMLPPGAGPVWQYQLNAGLVHEFIVPTCSYRMGTVNMGYGAAIIDGNTDTMLYAVLWLPSRFTQLYMYVITLSTLCFVIVFILCQNVLCKIRCKLRKTANNTMHGV